MEEVLPSGGETKMLFIASEYLKGLIAILWPLICPGDICIIVFGTIYLHYTSDWIIRVKSYKLFRLHHNNP